jgi:hypothetical protein
MVFKDKEEDAMRFLRPVFMFAFLGLSALILCQDANADPEGEKAKTIDELAARYDVSSCKECHAEIYAQWEVSAHSKSFFGVGARTAATIGTSITKGLMVWPYSGVKRPEDVKVKHLMLCAKCHLPQLEEATDDVAQEVVKAVFGIREKKTRKESVEKLQEVGINCLVCHQKKAITHKWAYGFPQRDAVYGTQDGEHEDEHYPVMKKSEIIRESIFCGQCHGLGPNLEFEQPSQCATAYGSYLFAYIAEGGHESCQSCHMKKSNKGHAIPAYQDPDMAEAAVRIEADAFGYYWRKDKTDGVIPLAVIRVEMENRTGHGIPDG